MTKMDLTGGISKVDTMLDASKNILGLLAEELNPEQSSVLTGVIIHLHNSLELLDRLEEQFILEGITA